VCFCYHDEVQFGNHFGQDSELPGPSRAAAAREPVRVPCGPFNWSKPWSELVARRSGVGGVASAGVVGVVGAWSWEMGAGAEVGLLAMVVVVGGYGRVVFLEWFVLDFFIGFVGGEGERSGLGGFVAAGVFFVFWRRVALSCGTRGAPVELVQRFFRCYRTGRAKAPFTCCGLVVVVSVLLLGRKLRFPVIWFVAFPNSVAVVVVVSRGPFPGVSGEKITAGFLFRVRGKRVGRGVARKVKNRVSI
jgi:hypothetical protein